MKLCVNIYSNTLSKFIFLIVKITGYSKAGLVYSQSYGFSCDV